MPPHVAPQPFVSGRSIGPYVPEDTGFPVLRHPVSWQGKGWKRVVVDYVSAFLAVIFLLGIVGLLSFTVVWVGVGVFR